MQVETRDTLVVLVVAFAGLALMAYILTRPRTIVYEENAKGFILREA